MSRITGILTSVAFFFSPFALMDGLNFKGNEVKAREIAKCDEMGPKTFIF